MKINSCDHVRDVFFSTEAIESGRLSHTFHDGRIEVCPFYVMRGWAGLRGKETPRGYFIIVNFDDCPHQGPSLIFNAYPERGEFEKITRKFRARAGAKNRTAEQIEAYEKKLFEAECEIILAVCG